MTQNKNQKSLLILFINCICAKSAPQILSIKRECTFLLLNFLIFGLCNSSANSLLEIFSFLITDLFASVADPPDVFYQKMYKPLSKFTLILVNEPQALYVNPGCLNCLSGIHYLPLKKLFIISFVF